MTETTYAVYKTEHRYAGDLMDGRQSIHGRVKRLDQNGDRSVLVEFVLQLRRDDHVRVIAGQRGVHHAEAQSISILVVPPGDRDHVPEVRSVVEYHFFVVERAELEHLQIVGVISQFGEFNEYII